MKEGFVSTVQHAVIIAAGSGERFRDSTNQRPKPLLEVAGVPLISRTIRTANQAGICSFTIITGHRAKMLEAFLDGKAFPGINIRCIRNEEWQRPNGLSALMAKGAVPEPFVLLMADHLFEAEIIRRLLTSTLPAGHCRLAVDFHPGKNIDLEDATKVQVVDGRISEIGKDLSYYNAIDTGIFLCSNALFEALETSISLGQESLSDGVRELARNQQMEATDIGDLFWQDVDNENDLKAGERLLIRSLVSETDSWLTRQINRRISLFVTRRLAVSGIKPNHITLFNLFLGLTGAALMLLGAHLGFVAGSVLFLSASILDGCDGEIARLKFLQSRQGALLDVATDNVTHLALFTCMTVGLIRFSGSVLYLAPGALLVAGSFASFLMSLIARKRLEGGQGLVFSESRLQDISESDRQKHLAKWLDRFANRDFAYLLLFLACINRTGWFLWIAGIGATIFGLLFYRTLARKGQ